MISVADKSTNTQRGDYPATNNTSKNCGTTYSAQSEHPAPAAGYASRNHVRGIMNEAEKRYPGTLFRISSAMASIKKAANIKKRKSNVRNCKKCGLPLMSKECRMCSFLSSLKN